MINEPESEEFGQDDIIHYADYINSNGPKHEAAAHQPADQYMEEHDPSPPADFEDPFHDSRDKNESSSDEDLDRRED